MRKFESYSILFFVFRGETERDKKYNLHSVGVILNRLPDVSPTSLKSEVCVGRASGASHRADRDGHFLVRKAVVQIIYKYGRGGI